MGVEDSEREEADKIAKAEERERERPPKKKKEEEGGGTHFLSTLAASLPPHCPYSMAKANMPGKYSKRNSYSSPCVRVCQFVQPSNLFFSPSGEGKRHKKLAKYEAMRRAGGREARRVGGGGTGLDP